MPYQPIENYGVVGDLHTIALIGMNGSVDFLCFPEFDSPTVFAAMLDEKKGGFFSLSPTFNSPRQRQLYLPDTNILLTRFLAPEGVAEVSDHMPLEEEDTAHNLVRRAKCVRGELTFRMVCAPRFDYGRRSHRVELRNDGREALFICGGPGCIALRLVSEVPMHLVNGDAVAEFTLAADQSAGFILEYVEQPDAETPIRRFEYVQASFDHTVNYWRRWIGRCHYRGRWLEMVHRSALTLKMLCYAPTGAMIAAPTFSLPETLGGVRNWDYRYTWIRDTSFCLYALIRLGYTDETRDFMGWISERAKELTDGEALQPLYGIRGRKEIPELILDHWEGYRGSRPVRIGNAAYAQLQLDIYGALMDSIYLFNKYGHPISYELWQVVVRLTDYVCANWRVPDEGIWEVRGGKREFLHSRLMCWVAIDRAVRLALKRSFPAALAPWIRERDAIYNSIMQEFWDPKQQAFVQARGSTALDASAFLMPLLKFISPHDPRWLSTMRAIERHLVYDSLVYRYDVEKAASDGLEGVEGTFCMCSFWYAECLSRSGEVERARFFFEKMLGYANHLGLYAEELGPTGEHLGNFPQGFTHLSLISAAWHIDSQLNQRGVRS